MDNSIEMMINEFPMNIIRSDTALTPYVNNISLKGNRKSLGKIIEYLHTSIAGRMFVAKRMRPDIHQTVAVLSTRVESPNENDRKI